MVKESISVAVADDARIQLQCMCDDVNSFYKDKRDAINSLRDCINDARAKGKTWKQIASTLSKAGLQVSEIYLRACMSPPPPAHNPSDLRAKTKKKSPAPAPAPAAPALTPSSTPDTAENGRNTPKPDRVFTTQRGNAV